MLPNIRQIIGFLTYNIKPHYEAALPLIQYSPSNNIKIGESNGKKYMQNHLLKHW